MYSTAGVGIRPAKIHPDLNPIFENLIFLPDFFPKNKMLAHFELKLKKKFVPDRPPWSEKSKIGRKKIKMHIWSEKIEMHIWG